MSFRENLKAELQYQGLLVKDLASNTGISRRTLDNYLRENCSEPTAENAVLIAKALKVSVEYLVTGMDCTVPSNIKPKVIEMIKEINCLSECDINFINDIIKRLKKSN